MREPDEPHSTSQNQVFKPRSQTTHHDWNGDESLRSAVIQTVAAVNGVDPIDLQQLYGVVDPDALESLFTRAPDGVPKTAGHVTFDFSGTEVTIYTSGEIVVVRKAQTRDVE